ncbi:MAG: DUF2292 domain-containing protein [Candidatus Binatia bacterium]
MGDRLSGLRYGTVTVVVQDGVVVQVERTDGQDALAVIKASNVLIATP